VILYYFSENARMRRNARNWLHLADKVYHFRRDRLTEPELASLAQERGNLRQKLKARADASMLKLAIEGLEPCLRQSGGTFYPKSTVVEYVEFFLVAAILFLGIRAFILQPFKIPTNSMWPSFYGMTDEIYATKDDEPGVLGRGFRFVAHGATSRRVDAPADGEVLWLIGSNRSDNVQLYRMVPGRRWLVLRTMVKEYSFQVGNEIVSIKVPADFQLEPILSEIWFGDREAWRSYLGTRLRQRDFLGSDDGRVALPTGHMVKKGDRMVSFDILTGDQLFVDRISYHFIRPDVGDGFVFRTRNIAGLGDKYYIKRLVGVPGDTLEVREPVLNRNGEAISGSRAFEYNARQEKRYQGYAALGRLAPGKTVTVPEANFFAMGDNSNNSEDGRMWGFVPAAEVVGRPLFIYYPFTRRWGPTR